MGCVYKVKCGKGRECKFVYVLVFVYGFVFDVRFIVGFGKGILYCCRVCVVNSICDVWLMWFVLIYVLCMMVGLGFILSC